MAPAARAGGARLAKSLQSCRSTFCSAENISRASTCGRKRCRSWRIPSRRRASCSPSSCGPSTRRRGRVICQHYEIIAGERRWRAAQIAGLTEIPAVIRHIPDEAAIAVALIENIQRENLNPLEEARALERLINEFALTHQQAADAVGRSRAGVSNLLRLLELAPEVAEQRREARARNGPCSGAAGAVKSQAAGRNRR